MAGTPPPRTHIMSSRPPDHRTSVRPPYTCSKIERVFCRGARTRVCLLSVWEMCGFLVSLRVMAGGRGQCPPSSCHTWTPSALFMVAGIRRVFDIQLPSFSCPGPGSSPCQGHEGCTPFPGADGPHRATGVHPFRAAWLLASSVSSSAAPCASFATVVGQNGSQKESVDAFSCLTVETDDVVVVAFAVVCEVFEEFVDSVIVWFLCI